MTRCGLAARPYLLWLAWQALKPDGRSPFQVEKLPVDGPRKLFAMGFVTNLLNPKIAMLYLALLPQFIDPAQGSVLTQSMVLGIDPDRHQRQRQCDHCAGGRLDRAVSRHPPDLADGAALADGHRARGLCGADGVGDAAGVKA